MLFYFTSEAALDFQSLLNVDIPIMESFDSHITIITQAVQGRPCMEQVS